MTPEELALLATMDEGEILELLNTILNTLGMHDVNIENLILDATLGLMDGIDYGFEQSQVYQQGLYDGVIGYLGTMDTGLRDRMYELYMSLWDSLQNHDQNLYEHRRDMQKDIVDATNFLSFAMAEYIKDAKQSIDRGIRRSESYLRSDIEKVTSTLSDYFSSGLEALETTFGDLLGSFGALWQEFITTSVEVLLWILSVTKRIDSAEWGTLEDFFKGYIEGLKTLPRKMEPS